MNCVLSKILVIIFLLSTHLIGQDEWNFYPDSSTIGIFVCDFQTGRFESANLKNFSECDSTGNINLPNDTLYVDIPLNYNYVDGNQGSRLDEFSYACTDEVFLLANVLISDTGKIYIPELFLPSDSFSVGDLYIEIPIPVVWIDPSCVELDYPHLDPIYDNAWNNLKYLNIINKIAESKFQVCVYFYTPIINDYSTSKTIILIYRPSKTETSLSQFTDWRNKDNYLKSITFPNPFNPSTTIKYTLHSSAKVKIEVFNLLGQKIETLLNQHMSAGIHKIKFNSNDLPNGVYVCKIEANDHKKIMKMVLLK